MATEITVPVKLTSAEITFDEAGVISKVKNMIEPYEGITPEIVAGMDLKEAKACRADLNRISKELNEARKVIKREYNKPLADFEAKVKAIDEMIKEPCEIIKEGIAFREEQAKQARIDHLRSVYYDFAPVLVEVVDFETLFEKEWSNATFGEKKAEEALMHKINRVADDLETLKNVNLEFRDESTSVFFRTLSLKDAIEHDRNRKEEAERKKAFDEQMEEIRREREEMAGNAVEVESKTVFEYCMTVRCTEEEFAQIQAYIASKDVERVGCKRRKIEEGK